MTTIVSLSLYSLLFATPGLAGHCPADYPHPYSGNCASASWCCSVAATDTGYCGNGDPDHCYGDGTPCSDPPCRAPTPKPTTHAGHCPADYPQPYDGNCASASWCCSVVATDTGYCGNGNRDHCYGDGTPCSDPPCQAALVDLAEEEEQEKEKDLLPPTTLTVTAGPMLKLINAGASNSELAALVDLAPPTTLTVTAGPMLKLINAGASNSELAEDTSLVTVTADPIPQRDVPAALWVCALGALALSTVAVAARKRSSVPDAYLNLAGEPQSADTSA